MRAALAIAALLIAGCGTHPDLVCEDIGLCRAQGDDQVAACQREAKAVTVESRASGCGAQADAFYACADANYTCKGDTPSFPGCDAARAAIDGCLEKQRAQNSCGQLEARLSTCVSQRPPAAPGPAACGVTELCASRCFLDDVSDVCRPQAGELVSFAHCVQQCP
jgi:hypothetical protein